MIRGWDFRVTLASPGCPGSIAKTLMIMPLKINLPTKIWPNFWLACARIENVAICCFPWPNLGVCGCVDILLTPTDDK
jgi:hypothetical protein